MKILFILLISLCFIFNQHSHAYKGIKNVFIEMEDFENDESFRTIAKNPVKGPINTRKVLFVDLHLNPGDLDINIQDFKLHIAEIYTGQPSTVKLVKKLNFVTYKRDEITKKILDRKVQFVFSGKVRIETGREEKISYFIFYTREKVRNTTTYTYYSYEIVAETLSSIRIKLKRYDKLACGKFFHKFGHPDMRGKNRMRIDISLDYAKLMKLSEFFMKTGEFNYVLDILNNATKALKEEGVSTKPPTLLFRYGVVHYNLGNYETALGFFRQTMDTYAYAEHSNYYTALSHLHMNDDDTAYPYLLKAANAKDTAISLSAKFYLGVYYFNREEYGKARTLFEDVLQNFKSPERLKDASNDYLNEIDAEERIREQTGLFTGYLSLVPLKYDSNIWLIAGEIESVSNKGGFEFLATAGLGINIIASRRNLLNFQTGLSMTYHPDKVLSSFDTWTAFSSLNYQRNFAAGRLPFNLKVSPNFSYSLANLTGTASFPPKDKMLISGGIDNALTVAILRNHMPGIELNIKYDKYYLSYTDPQDNSDAWNLYLTPLYSWFSGGGTDLKLVKFKFGAEVNIAKGNNYFKTSPLVDLTVIHPTGWAISFSHNLNFTYEAYMKHAQNRDDMKLYYSLDIGKSFFDGILSVSQKLEATKNFSSVSTNSYLKLATTTTLTVSF